MKRVAVTGLGAICGLGHSSKEVWENAIAGKSGISQYDQLDKEKYPVKIAGEVKNFEVAEDVLPAKEASRYDRFIHFALHSTAEAMKDAKIDKDNLPYPAEKIGAILGVGMGGFPEIERTHEKLLDKGTRRVGPFFIPAIIPNMTTGLISINYGLKGINYSIASACASGGHALSAACYEIMNGRQDMMVTGGCESVISGLTLSGFANMKALSRRNDEPDKASRPFDEGRDGFVIGEGASVFILEDYDKAVARGATIYAEIVGHGASSDAHHITAPHPDGHGAIQCMKMALESAGLKKEDINYVNAHGTSTPLGDVAETKAIKEVFGDHSKDIAVSSTKSMTGHLLGAAAALESFFCIKALHHGVLPPTINLENQDENCDLYYVPNKSEERPIQYALNNSFGFGGTNSCLIFKKA